MMRKALLLVIALGIVVSMAAAADAAKAARTGKQVYESVCIACHGTGAAGAPKFGDTAWVEREKKEGLKELVKDAIKGERAMPPKGGCTDCSDNEIRAAVQYMIDAAKKK
ncbi:MAG: c-type cytochrome [Nitrospirota bacterium]